MENKSWITEDKSTWGKGDWEFEPDKEQFTDDATGFPCLIVRNNGGALCGYVGVPQSHPFFGREYSDCYMNPEHNSDSPYEEKDYISVHGGLTFSGLCRPGNDDESKGICHIVGEGEDDKVWWLGFDCAHWNDYSPEYGARHGGGFKIGHEIYRNIEYVKEQCADLAKQLKEVEKWTTVKLLA